MNIFDYVTDRDIFNRYFLKVDLTQKYTNPLRPGDKNPGCFYKYYKGKLYFVDFGENPTHIDSIGIVMILFNLTFAEAIIKIKEDFNLVNYNLSYQNYNMSPRVQNKPKMPSESNNVTIRCAIQDFTQIDIDYWKQFNINLDILRFFEVYSALKCHINDELFHIYTNADPMYMYLELNSSKIYRPKANKYFKWRTNFKGGLLEGYQQLPEKGDLLIITKSRKDVMSLYSIGYPSVALKSESSLITQNAYNILKNRFKKIITLFDNDEQGIKALELAKKEYNLNGFYIDKNKGVKDVSSYIKTYSVFKTQLYLENEIKNHL